MWGAVGWRGDWLPPYSCVVARDIHRLAACQMVAEDVCGNVPHAQRSSNTAPLRRPHVRRCRIWDAPTEDRSPTFLWYSFGAAGLLALVIGVVYLLPFPLPRFADPYYQYLKRHGLLDATGHPLPDAERHGTRHDVPVGVDPPRPGRPRHLITATSSKPTNSTPPATNPPWKQFPRPSYGATSTGSSHPRRHANDHHSMEPR